MDFATTMTETSEVATSTHGGLLIVEDEKNERAALTNFLEGENYTVHQAASGRDAVEQTQKTGSAGVVLMDIRMPKMDGIDAAVKIERIDPTASVIFVSAFAKEEQYHERAKEAKLRVGGWFTKPILGEKTPLLFEVINREQEKVKTRRIFEQARIEGIESRAALRVLELSGYLPDIGIVHELAEEIEAGKMGGDLMRLERQIDGTYDEIRDLVERSAGEPDIAAEIEQKYKQLRSFQEEAAAAMERQATARLQLKPGEGYDLLERAARLLGQ